MKARIIFIFFILIPVALFSSDYLTNKVKKTTDEFVQQFQRISLKKEVSFDYILYPQNRDHVVVPITEMNERYKWFLLPEYYYDTEIDSEGTLTGLSLDYRPTDDVYSVFPAFYGCWYNKPISSLITYKNIIIASAKAQGTSYSEIFNESINIYGVSGWKHCCKFTSGTTRIVWFNYIIFNDNIGYNIFYMTTESSYNNSLSKLYFELVLALFVFGNQSPVESLSENFSNIHDFSLEQNYPNPFNNTTTIDYSVNNVTKVRLDIVDIRGKLVETLFNRIHSAGNYSINLDTNNLSSGFYIYKINSQNKSVMKKMLLIK